jgi:hypothetical protein
MKGWNTDVGERESERERQGEDMIKGERVRRRVHFVRVRRSSNIYNVYPPQASSSRVSLPNHLHLPVPLLFCPSSYRRQNGALVSDQLPRIPETHWSTTLKSFVQEKPSLAWIQCRRQLSVSPVSQIGGPDYYK